MIPTHLFCCRSSPYHCRVLREGKLESRGDLLVPSFDQVTFTVRGTHSRQKELSCNEALFRDANGDVQAGQDDEQERGAETCVFVLRLTPLYFHPCHSSA